MLIDTVPKSSVFNRQAIGMDAMENHMKYRMLGAPSAGYCIMKNCGENRKASG